MTHTTADQRLILVTGGTGSRVVTRVRAAGYPVRVGSRTADISFDCRTDRTTGFPRHGEPAGLPLRHCVDGRNAKPADEVPRALGREPNDFADYVMATAITAVWNVPKQ